MRPSFHNFCNASLDYISESRRFSKSILQINIKILFDSCEYDETAMINFAFSRRIGEPCP